MTHDLNGSDDLAFELADGYHEPRKPTPTSQQWAAVTPPHTTEPETDVVVLTDAMIAMMQAAPAQPIFTAMVPVSVPEVVVSIARIDGRLPTPGRAMPLVPARTASPAAGVETVKSARSELPSSSSGEFSREPGRPEPFPIPRSSPSKPVVEPGGESTQSVDPSLTPRSSPPKFVAESSGETMQARIADSLPLPRSSPSKVALSGESTQRSSPDQFPSSRSSPSKAESNGESTRRSLSDHCSSPRTSPSKAELSSESTQRSSSDQSPSPRSLLSEAESSRESTQRSFPDHFPSPRSSPSKAELSGESTQRSSSEQFPSSRPSPSKFVAAQEGKPPSVASMQTSVPPPRSSPATVSARAEFVNSGREDELRSSNSAAPLVRNERPSSPSVVLLEPGAFPPPRSSPSRIVTESVPAHQPSSPRADDELGLLDTQRSPVGVPALPMAMPAFTAAGPSTTEAMRAIQPKRWVLAAVVAVVSVALFGSLLWRELRAHGPADRSSLAVSPVAPPLVEVPPDDDFVGYPSHVLPRVEGPAARMQAPTNVRRIEPTAPSLAESLAAPSQVLPGSTAPSRAAPSHEGTEHVNAREPVAKPRARPIPAPARVKSVPPPEPDLLDAWQ